MKYLISLFFFILALFIVVPKIMPKQCWYVEEANSDRYDLYVEECHCQSVQEVGDLLMKTPWIKDVVVTSDKVMYGVVHTDKWITSRANEKSLEILLNCE